jgi:hypothetical protein
MRHKRVKRMYFRSILKCCVMTLYCANESRAALVWLVFSVCVCVCVCVCV